MKDLLSEIESYWTTRAEGYSEVNHKELNGMQKGAWLEVLKETSCSESTFHHDECTVEEQLL